MGTAKNKENVLYPLLLFVVTVVSRFLFTSKILYHLDSVQFALATIKYDVLIHQPHPPGYFLYVLLGKFMNLFTHDANTSFVLISVVSSGLTVSGLYVLAARMYDKTTAFLTSVLAITSPLFWFHGEVALTYILEAFFSVSFALLCWKILDGQFRLVYVSALLLALIGGVRQSTLVFLVPLWLYSIRKSPKRYIFVSFALLTAGILSWFLPMLSMTGGYARYQAATAELWAFTIEPFTVLNMGFQSFFANSRKLLQSLIYGLGLSAAFAAFYLFKNGFKHMIEMLLSKRGIFIGFWIMPAIFFHLFVHTGPSGYSLIFMPCMLMLSVKAVGILTRGDLKKFGLVIGLTILLNVYVFLFLKTPVSLQELEEQQAYMSAFTKQVREKFLPPEVAIFSDVNPYYSARHFMYYLPEYRVYMLHEGVDIGGRRRRVLWGQNLNTFISSVVFIPRGTKYFVNPLDDERVLTRLKGSYIRRLSEEGKGIAFYADITLAPEAYRGVEFVVEK